MGDAIEGIINIERVVAEFYRKSREGKDLVKRQELTVSRELKSIETIDIKAVRNNAPTLPD
jgi:hypothetical protein